MIPVITNLTPDLAVDHAATAANVRYVVDRGVRYGQGVLLAAGAGGDFPSLTLDERKAVIGTIVEAARGEAPVVAGAQDTNPAVSVELARYADELGAVAIQLAPTYYYEPSDEDVLRLFRMVHDATRRIGIMVYNTFWLGFNMSLDLIARLAELERVVSLKWSTPDGAGTYLRGLTRFADRFAVVDNQGLEIMNHMLGGTGFITHLATVWPEHDLALFQQMEAGDYVGALDGFRRANFPWGEFRGKIWARSGGESNVVKAALELVGRPGGPNRPPTRGLDDAEREELRALLQQIGVPNVRAT
jgi:4-hydroxy-tetrahydrodipicolinate synthase